MLLRPVIRPLLRTLSVASLLLLASASWVHAAKLSPEKPAKATRARTAAADTTATVKHSHPATLGSSLGSAGTLAAAFEGIDLPRYVEPPAYSVNLVVNPPEGKEIVLKRFVDHDRIRTDITAEGHDISMIELGDESGTSYTVMPKEKLAIKQSREAMARFAKGMQQEPETAQETSVAPAARVKVEDLGDEKLNDRTVKKLRMSAAEGSALGWFDRETGAPLKMESTADGKTSSIEWRDMKVGAQPASVYEVPEDFAVTDMDEMMSRMKSTGGPGGMGAMGSMANMGGMAGIPGMGGMPGMGAMGGGMKSMAGGMGQNFGAQMGGQLGSTLGASLGGPLGAMAGHYIGGRIGGMIGRKTAQAIIPGK